MEVIKKYNNRKLYSTTLSKYVPQEYILDLVKTDQKFQVIDNETKQDITKKALQGALNKLPLSMKMLTDLVKRVDNLWYG